MMAHLQAAARWTRFWRAGADALAILAVFWLVAGWPPPDPNEAHYLCRAKHFWNPSWIPSDFFLDSHDTHRVFYFACGWLTRLVSLPATAWIGRFGCWLLLAIGWRRLSWTLAPRPGFAILSAALYALLVEHGHMAGEWVIGGFEAKSIAYGLVFIALAELARDHWKLAWLWLGAASSFHVLVGGWAVIAVLFAWLTLPGRRPKLLAMLPWMLAGGVLALPGVLPALEATRGASPDVVAAADDIYVFRRLYHHLWPLAFKPWFVERQVLLLLTWVGLCAFYPATGGQLRIRRTVLGAVLICGAGVLLALGLQRQPELAAAAMRFYWFRLADALLPLGVSLAAIGWLAVLMADRPRTGRWLLAGLVIVMAAGLAEYLPARLSPGVPRADGPGKVINDADWRAACEFVAHHTRPDARCLTPRNNQTFKWYAGRSEVVTWKDMPQAPGQLVEWWTRLEDVFGTGQSPPEKPWYESLAAEGDERLTLLGRRYGAGYVLTAAEPRLGLPLEYRNKSYALYRLPP